VDLRGYCVEIESHQQRIEGALLVGEVGFEYGIVGQSKQTLALVDL
jgi:hypothetical protein